jgi:hypothetical protein
MTSTCLRCDWVGETTDTTCPTCGAPLYRSPPRDRERHSVERWGVSSSPRGPSQHPEPPSASHGPEHRPSLPGRSVGTSDRSVFLLVGVVFALLAFLLTRGGGPDIEPRSVSPSPLALPRSGGLLVYAAPDGQGAARLWRWNLLTGTVVQGPLIREPVAMVNVGSPEDGWLGVTSDLGNGVHEAAVLDSLDPGAVIAPLGRADIVTWAREGSSAIFVDRGPLLDGCRREISVSVERVGVESRDVVMHDTICGDVISAGRTSIGYFLTEQGLGRVDVVGQGYPDAGVLLEGYGVIAISPGGDMLVTPGSEFLPAIVPTRPVTGGYDPPPLWIAGQASAFRQFSGPPVPYVVQGIALRVDEVLGYAPDETTALVIGRLGGDRPGLWELPLGVARVESTTARYVAEVGGVTAAAYANDGTAFVVTEGRLWRLRNHRLTPIDVPEGAPVPNGPLAWIVREPTADL